MRTDVLCAPKDRNSLPCISPALAPIIFIAFGGVGTSHYDGGALGGLAGRGRG